MRSIQERKFQPRIQKVQVAPWPPRDRSIERCGQCFARRVRFLGKSRTDTKFHLFDNVNQPRMCRAGERDSSTGNPPHSSLTTSCELCLMMPSATRSSNTVRILLSESSIIFGQPFAVGVLGRRQIFSKPHVVERMIIGLMP